MLMYLRPATAPAAPATASAPPPPPPPPVRAPAPPPPLGFFEWAWRHVEHCPCRQPVDGGNDPAEGSVRADVVVPAGVLEGVATLAECLRRLPCRVVLPVPLQYEVTVVLAEAQLVALVPDGDRELAVLLRVKLYRPATPPV